MSVNELKRYKIIFEASEVRTPGDSMNSKGRMDIKL
jgi:hypothetical protein